MNQSDLLRWTRNGSLSFAWTRFESFEKLVLLPSLRERFNQRVETFLKGESEFHKLELPWRYGLFLFGPSGSGKTAASRGLAHRLGWQHFSVPAHEILDAHLLERALSDAISQKNRVIVLEDVDLIIRTMEPEVFFTLLDHAMGRAEGSFWIATSRNAENTPKTQLLRPGRFDESIRMEPPQSTLRNDLFTALIGPQEEGSDKAGWLTEWVELSHGLTFSHFEELRQIFARLKMEGRDESEIFPTIRSYIEDQLIAGDRLGGLSDQTQRLQDRMNQVDPRVLMAALDMTDVFRLLMEKVIGDAAEQAKTESAEEGS